MAKLIPTKIGDVLILWTQASFTVLAVGQVTKDGQQDFDTYLTHDTHLNVTYTPDRAAAEIKARALVATGRRVFFLNIDSGDWSEISN